MISSFSNVDMFCNGEVILEVEKWLYPKTALNDVFCQRDLWNIAVQVF